MLGELLAEATGAAGTAGAVSGTAAGSGADARSAGAVSGTAAGSGAEVRSAGEVGQVTAWLNSRLAAAPRPVIAPELRRAWQLIVGSGGSMRVSAVAADVGWSRRHLTAMMRAEIGVGAKDLARLARFGRSRRMMTGAVPLVDVAAGCGFDDQSHLNAEWRQFAGCTPGQWMADELPTLTGAG